MSFCPREEPGQGSWVGRQLEENEEKEALEGGHLMVDKDYVEFFLVLDMRRETWEEFKALKSRKGRGNRSVPKWVMRGMKMRKVGGKMKRVL